MLTRSKLALIWKSFLWLDRRPTKVIICCHNDYSFEEGTYSFDLDMPTNSYEFQFNVNPGDNNFDVQSKIARLINQSDIGLLAEVKLNRRGESALSIQSKQTGLSADETSIFSIQSGSSWNEINTLGISHITTPATNSVFRLNGQEHSSLSNTFTINRSFEVTMHKASAEAGKPVHIGFQASTLPSQKALTIY